MVEVLVSINLPSSFTESLCARCYDAVRSYREARAEGISVLT